MEASFWRRRVARRRCYALVVKLSNSSNVLASAWALLAFSFFCSAVLSLSVRWERSQLKAKLRYAIWRGRSLRTLAFFSNDPIHLLHLSLFCRDPRAKKLDQGGMMKLHEVSNQPQRRKQRRRCSDCCCCMLQHTEQRRAAFSYGAFSRQKNIRMTDVFPDKNRLVINHRPLWAAEADAV